MITPDQFPATSVYDLVKAAAEGKVGIDQRWLRAILDRGEDAVPDLVRFGKEMSSCPVPLDDELIAIFRHIGSPASVPFFVDYFRNNGPDIPDEVVDALFPLRQAALEPLIQLRGEMEEEEAGEVAFCLAAFRIRDPRVLAILLDRLEYDLSEGAINLSLYGDPEARPALERMLAETTDEHLRRQLQEAIEDLGKEESEPVQAHFNIFDLFPEKSRPEVGVLEEPDLLEMLASPDPEYRFTAAAGFINRDLSEGVKKALLQRVRSDDSPEVRAKCWEALGSEVVSDEDVYKAMLARLKDESAPKTERAGALAGLGQRAEEDAIRPFAEEFYHDPQTRAAALAAMWNSLDRSYSIYFPPHLDDGDPEVRKQAISGVGYLGIHESAEKLRSYFEHEEYRANALFAYALAARSEVSPGRMRGLLRRIDELAGGLTEEENELVEIALDERLLLHGHKPVFHPDQHQQEEAESAKAAKVGRNDPCPCGSGKKYKKCCGA